MDCIFCKIANKEMEAYKLYEDDTVLVFLDINQDCAGHSLVICKEHYVNLYDIPEDTLNHIMDIARNMGKYLEEKLNCDGITLVQNNGIAQEVKHFHLHIIPKYKKKNKMSIEEVYDTLKR